MSWGPTHRIFFKVPGGKFTIEISSVDNPGILDQSDNFFTVAIAPPSGGTITVISPNGGESALRGAVFPITWASTGDIGANVKIYVRKGGSGAMVASSTPNDGHFDWAVPNYPLDFNYVIEISAVADPAIVDSSDGLFSLTDMPPPDASMTLNAPNGGEALVRAGTASITWTSTGAVGSSVKIVARKGAQSAVIVNATPNDGVYDWTVPAIYPHGPGFLIEISAVADPGIVDASDDTFTINP